MKWWKEVIRPATYWYTDELGKPQKLVVTADHTRYWCDQGRKMLSAGLSIPIPLEHQASVHAMTATEKAAANLVNNTGWVEGYALRGDRLFALTNIADDSISAKLPFTIKYTSPWINSFTDGNGTKWEGVITHLALTSRPRITAQEPFTTPEAALSLSGVTPAFLPAKGPPGPLALSLAGLIEPGPRGALAPRYPMAFSVWTGAKLATDDAPPMAKKDEPADKKPPMKEGSKDGSEAGKEVKPEEGAGAVEEELEMTLTDILKEIVSALWGIDLPEGTTEDNLGQNLLKALLGQFKGENTDMTTPTTPPPTPPPGTNGAKAPPAPPVVQESPPMYMSLEAINAIADPTMKQLAMSHRALVERTIGQAKAVRDERISRLAKRMPAAGRDKLLAQAQHAPIALAVDGTINDSLASTLDILEGGLVDLPELLSNPAAARLAMEQPHPTDPGGGSISPERAKRVIAELSKAAGVEAS